MTLEAFEDILLSVTDGVYHFTAPSDLAQDYIVWQETGGKAFYADNMRKEQIRQIQVELYAAEEYPSLLYRLLAVLEEADVAFEEPEAVYGQETGVVRYTVACEIL